MPSPLSQRLRQAVSEMSPQPTQADLARVADVRPASVSDWFSGKTRRLGRALVPVARFLGVTPEWLNDGKLPKHPPIPGEPFGVREFGGTYGSGYEIPVAEAPRSCGGGRGDMELTSGVVVKEAAWFQRYGVTPETVLAVVADGDGNADYITHGDVVFFDTGARTPESGTIVLVQHPDGLRIQRLRRELGGDWLLEFINPDKRRFPSERIPAAGIDSLVIVGRFFYRQGG